MKARGSLLLVANWDSNVGYAWWLMESFWAELARHYHARCPVLLAYPSISRLPQAIANAPLTPLVQDFTATDLRSVWQQGLFLRRHKVQGMYFSDQSTRHWRYLLFRLCGVRLIITHDHTPGLRTRPTGLKRLAKWLSMRLPWITADGMLGASEFVRQRLIDINLAPARRCHAVPNGLPAAPPEPPAEVHQLFAIPRERSILVMTGRASHYKSIDFVLHALARLLRRGERRLHFLFCGDGPHLEEFQQLARQLGITNQVTFAGRRQDVPQLLEDCDIAIHPSQGEVGYSLSILEYMRAGLPVLVPNNPSVCGATRHGQTGLIYRDGDLESACTALVQLLDQPKWRQQLGEQARNEVARHYTLSSTHAALLEAFQHIDRRGLLNGLSP